VIAMPTYRYPVLLCRDPAGGFTAFGIDSDAVAFGLSAKAVKQQLKDYLLGVHKEHAYASPPDFTEPELSWHAVTIRPEYRTQSRVQPCDRPVFLKVPCVKGTRASGQPSAELPLLGIRFDYNNAAELNSLISRYATQKLSGLTPEELSRLLPPAQVELFDLPLRVPHDLRSKAKDRETPPTLKAIAEPLAERSVRAVFARAWERESEVATLVLKLHREKANVLLVGDAGVGKTTLMVDAVKLAEEQEPSPVKDEGPKPRRYWLSSAGRIIAGMKYLGQWEERVENLIAELGEIPGVLCTERLLDLVQRGGRGPGDSIAAFLMPYLARGELRMIAEATPAELDACRRLLPGFADLFQIVRVEAFDSSRALKVIDRQLETAASGHSLEILRGTGERIVRLFRRFQPYSAFPGPASGFARELVNGTARRGVKEVGPDDAVQRFRDRTGLPELFLNDELPLNRDDVLTWFRNRVVDQPAACASAADTVMTVKAGLNDPKRPLSVQLFCGPTGVGKTFLAQSLADYFFGHSHTPKKPGESPRLLRFDMSEFGGYDAVDRLIGSRGGEPGELIRRVRQQPFCVLLLDEIEKAAAPVFDALMGVLDEGRLTDPFGRETNFRSAIILMTSNLGAGSGNAIGFESQTRSTDYTDAAMKFFRPEFFNRMDAVVAFEPLRAESVKVIAKRELTALLEREGLARRGITVQWGDALVEHLAAAGFDARYGARPLQRTIERIVVAEFAKWLLAFPETGGRTIRGDWTGECVVWTVGG
jgi:ATP-dependent Clp protease ATP-binding subunit ClpC